MTATKRTRLSPQERRAQLIELGVDMLATRRLDELSVELIAQTAGISRGLLFHYFASKQEFHLEVARAAAAEMIRRTEPDPDLPPVDALAGAVGAFVDYVEENPDNYISLVRGASAGDDEMRAIFDSTRAILAQRVVSVIGELGFSLNPRADLAVHGWVAFVEECVIRWLALGKEHDGHAVSRAELLQTMTNSLPALLIASSVEQAGELAALVTATVTSPAA